MRGERKPSTLAKLDRSRVLPFYLTPEEKALYDQDDYKYLIHLYRLFPTDHFHVLQYLMLKFHPLILRVCSKYHNRGIGLDWAELVSFARHAFVELIMRFTLKSTLYFRTYIPLALDRAVNDRFIYAMRRLPLTGAVRLAPMEPQVQDALLEESNQFLNTDGEDEAAFLSMMQEVLGFVDGHYDFTPQERAIFREFYVTQLPIDEIALKRNMRPDVTQKKLKRVLRITKEHVKKNYL